MCRLSIIPQFVFILRNILSKNCGYIYFWKPPVTWTQKVKGQVQGPNHQRSPSCLTSWVLTLWSSLKCKNSLVRLLLGSQFPSSSFTRRSARSLILLDFTNCNTPFCLCCFKKKLFPASRNLDHQLIRPDSDAFLPAKKIIWHNCALEYLLCWKRYVFKE